MSISILKSMLQDIINDRPEQAQAAMHEFFIAKSRELTESKLNESDNKSKINDFDVDVSNKQISSLRKMPLKSSVDGDFYCHNNNLTSLEGAPTEVRGDFDCNRNLLKSLKGAPSSIGNSFYCHKNNLTSLEGAPEKIYGNFVCDDNKITSLKGAPSSIGNMFYCHNNNLTSLRDIHKYIKHIGHSASFQNNPIKSHVLGLLLIDGLQGVFLDNMKVQKIINKHLKGDRDVMACQKELIDAGFDEFAQL